MYSRLVPPGSGAVALGNDVAEAIVHEVREVGPGIGQLANDKLLDAVGGIAPDQRARGHRREAIAGVIGVRGPGARVGEDIARRVVGEGPRRRRAVEDRGETVRRAGIGAALSSEAVHVQETIGSGSDLPKDLPA